MGSECIIVSRSGKVWVNSQLCECSIVDREIDFKTHYDIAIKVLPIFFLPKSAKISNR
jgi:hypothetical protein